ncbi:MAG: helix-turn-helix domain-containing protein, partial [Thermoanaerobaculia bacterium]
MQPEQRWQREVDKAAEGLRRKMTEAGLPLEEVAERAGIALDELRHALDGTAELRLPHVVGVLEALGVPLIEFFVEVYGPPPDWLSDQPDHYQFATTVRVLQKSLLRRMIWKLKEKGVFTAEEMARMLEELERTIS